MRVLSLVEASISDMTTKQVVYCESCTIGLEFRKIKQFNVRDTHATDLTDSVMQQRMLALVLS